MAVELDGRELGDGRRAVLVRLAASGGGRWGRPGYLSVAVLPPGVPQYVRRSQAGIEVIDRVRVDTRYMGPRSAYHAVYERLSARLARLG